MSPDVALLIEARPLSPIRRVRLLGELLAVYARVRWLVRRRGVPATVEVLRNGVQDQHDADVARSIGLRLAHIVERSLRPLPTDTRCLMRSLVLTGLLARRGVRSEIGIGAEPGETFQAHAWVEHGGRALAPTLGYAPLVRM